MNIKAIEAVQALQPYQAGKPVEELERELGIDSAIKLASNENPWGCSQHVAIAINDSLKNLSLYPDANAYYLKQALAEHYDLNINQFTIGNGSNDVLDLLARTFLTVGDEAIYSEYAFLVYPLVIQAVGATAKVSKALDIHSDQPYGHDLNAMLKLITDKTKIIFIANPNNPTGTYFAKTDLDVFLKQVPDHIIVVIDEAYFEYVDVDDFPNGLHYLKNYKNVVVTRTFSKVHGLASLRIGYAVSHESITDVLNRVRQPFNANSLALAAAIASLNDVAFVASSKANNLQALTDFKNYLEKKGLPYIPSVGNFITVDFSQYDASFINNELLKRGVIVRPVANYHLPNHLRISMGTVEEMKRLKKSLNELIEPSDD